MNPLTEIEKLQIEIAEAEKKMNDALKELIDKNPKFRIEPSLTETTGYPDGKRYKYSLKAILRPVIVL